MIDTPLRFSPSTLARSTGGCPRYRALKALPARSRTNGRRPKRRIWETFGLGPLDKVLDLHEFDGYDVDAALERWRGGEGRGAHPALARWTEHAVRRYLEAAARLHDGLALEPVSRLWARRPEQPAEGPTGSREEIVYGRRYSNNEVRELRIVRFREVGGRPRDEAEIAMAAAVLATGGPVYSDRWAPRLHIGRSTRPERVRIVEIGCADGSGNVLFDGTPEEALAAYEGHARGRLQEVAAGEELRPGFDCGKCPLVDTCPAVPSVPGLLGVDDDARPRRTWSVTTARRYNTCALTSYLHELNLPRDIAREENESTTRGRVVHDEIEARHRRSPLRVCGTDEVVTESLAASTADLVGREEARLRLQMLADHSFVCPARHAGEDAEFHPEQHVVVHDPSADVVVIARIDLLYRVGRRWRYRETKTSKYVYEGNLLENYKQIALAILLSAEGVLPGGQGGCHVELERLTASGPVLTEFDVADPELVQAAREVVRSAVVGWHADETPAASPDSKTCGSCGFNRWCPDAVAEARA
ncbi:PD-(D/E)XK nuclease family protein [Spirillospora sp. NPDC049652]